MMEEVLVIARTRWPDIPDDVAILPIKAQKCRFPVMETRAIFDRDLTWDFALADMTLHPEYYTLERKCEIREKAGARFRWLEVSLEPVDALRLGYSAEIKTLCIGKDGWDADKA